MQKSKKGLVVTGGTIAAMLVVLMFIGGSYAIMTDEYLKCKVLGLCEEEVTNGDTVQQYAPMGYMPIQPTAPTTTTTIIQQVPTTSVPQITAGAIPIESVKAIVKDKYTMGTPSTEVSFEFHAPGADVSDPNIQALDTIHISTAGTGTSTSTDVISSTPIFASVVFSKEKTGISK